MEESTEDKPISQYEIIREHNISQMNAELEKMGFYKQLQAAKDAVATPESSTKTSTKSSTKASTKSSRQHPPRKSTRDKKDVSYKLDSEDEDYKVPRQKRRKKSDNKENIDPQPSTSSHFLRQRKEVTYNQPESMPHDHYIWCSDCNELKYDGCEVHVPIFAEFNNLNLAIEPSCAARNSGEGLVNRGELIKEGTLLGPYYGKFWTKDQYKKLIKAKQESGNAWVIRDEEGLNIVGYIDPGRDLNPKLHWMAKINCPARSTDQNLVGFQFKSKIYYRAIKDIPHGKELLVWYGNQYAKELGIDISKLDYYKGKEDHKSEGVMCNICKTLFSSLESLTVHLGGHCGKKSIPCQKCDKTFRFSSELFDHNFKEHCQIDQINSKICPVCSKNFSSKRNMQYHYKIIHEQVKQYKCETCGVEFAYKNHLSTHISAVHLKLRPFKCDLCESSFTRPDSLKRHIKIVHEGIKHACEWDGCNYTAGDKVNLRDHFNSQHTGEYRWECEICLANGVWAGWATRTRYTKHRKTKHPEVWEQEQSKFCDDNQFVCRYSKCLKRFATEIEKSRHEKKLHK